MQPGICVGNFLIAARDGALPRSSGNGSEHLGQARPRSNFQGDGTEGADFSEFKINTYRGQVHWEWGAKWKTDFFFWHMRQAFNMFAEDSVTTDKFKQIGNIFWVLLQGKLGENDSLVFVPGYTAVEDRYSRASDKQRHNRYKNARGDLKYLRKFAACSIGIEVDGRLITNKGERYWAKHNEGDGKAQAFFDWGKEGYHIRLEGGRNGDPDLVPGILSPADVNAVYRAIRIHCRHPALAILVLSSKTLFGMKGRTTLGHEVP